MPRHALAPLPLLALFGVGACTSDPVVQRTDLALALGVALPKVHGVTVEPQTGRRFVLDAEHGVFLEVEGRFERYAGLEELRADGHEPLSAFTDLAAVGHDQFALIAKNDGFLFDQVTGVFQRHFCYEPSEIPAEPDPEPNPVEPVPQPISPEPVPAPVEPRPDPIDPGEEYFQLAKNLAFDPRGARLIAQPQTFADDDGALLAAHIGTFARSDGTEQDWFELPNAQVDAGGLAIDAEGRVLLGWGTSIWRYAFATRSFEPIADLTSVVEHIDGLALDDQTHTALVIDNATKELVELDLDLILP